MTNEFEMRAQIETFLFREAACLDAWQLDEWLQMFTSDCAYEIAPIGIDDPEAASPKTELFVVCDDRVRLEHRVKRLKDPKAHAEFPHSRTRHQYTNVLVTADDGAELTARAELHDLQNKKKADCQLHRFHPLPFGTKRRYDSNQEQASNAGS